MDSHNKETDLHGVSTLGPGGAAVSLHPPPIGVREALPDPGGADLASLIPGKAENGVVRLYLCPFLSGAESADPPRRNGDRAGAVGAAWPQLEASVGKVASDEDEVAAVRLTSTETQVMRFLAEGKTNRAIAREMFISINTVKTHVRAIFQKLGVNTRGCAVTRAVVAGLIDWPGFLESRNHPFG